MYVFDSKKQRMLDNDPIFNSSNDESSEDETSDDSMIGERKEPSCARRISEDFEFDDDASNENDISSDKEPSTRSTVGEESLNEEQDGNYDQKDDAPKGHDISNAELELYFGNVSIYIVFETLPNLIILFIQDEEETMVSVYKLISTMIDTASTNLLSWLSLRHLNPNKTYPNWRTLNSKH